MHCITLIFSKDRALQLDATLRSFLFHCNDANSSQIRVLYITTSTIHEKQYEQLKSDYQHYKYIQFITEQDFRNDVIALIAPFDYVLFLTDDNIFVRDFSLSEVIESLQKNPDTVGFSLRLGRNTTYCYPLDKAQKLPDFQPIGKGILKYNWTVAEYDFGYPLEVSSSVYRTEDILPFIAQLPFRNPNTLEATMNENKSAFQQAKPFLLCYEQSVTFCAPINIVQTDWLNRTSSKIEYTTDNLAKLFEEGYRIDIASYSGFIPNACHQEVELKFTEPVKPVIEKQPSVSVIIPCYNQAQFLPEAVESVVNQTFQDWECIIVNDGSPDNTSEVARDLIKKYPTKKIILLEKENGGLADARNFGIKNAKAKYILPLDADDKIHPEMLQKTVTFLETHPEIAFTYTDALWFGKVHRIVRAAEYDFRRQCFQNIPNYCSLYKREVWETVRGYNTNMIWGYEDWDFWVGCTEKGLYGQRIPEPLFMYRIKDESMYTKALQHDVELKAQIVLNHPILYEQEIITWAETVLQNAKNSLKTNYMVTTKLTQKHNKKDSFVKILFVVHSSHTQNLSGTELYTYNLAQELRKRGYEVRILYPEYDTTRPFGAITEYNHEGLSVASMNVHPPQNIVETFMNEQIGNAFRNYLSSLDVDLVHFHHFIGFSTSPLQVCSQMGIPAVVTLHDEWILCEQIHYLQPDGSFCTGPETVEKCVNCFVARHPNVSFAEYMSDLSQIFTLRHQFLQNALNWVDTLIVPSNFLLRELKMHGFFHPNTLLIPFGLYPFKTLPHEPQEGTLRFTYIGNINFTKGLDVVIQAFNLLNTGKAELNIYGAIQNHNYYQQVIAMNLKGQAVKYHGTYTPDDLPSILAKTNVAVIPSRSEHYPFVVRECLHARVPVIASEVGGIPEIIKDGENGLLFRSGDFNDLARKLQSFILNPKKIAAFRKRIKPVRTIAEESEQLEAIYREILARRVKT
jgi:glycosyltransferase involved in cell wall biosynthesis